MANNYNSNPIQLDTTMTSGWRASQTLYASGSSVGIRPTKIMIVANTSTSAGTIVFTDNASTPLTIYPTVGVAASQAAGTVIYNDNITDERLCWKDFKITGQTAAGVTVFIWYRV